MREKLFSIIDQEKRKQEVHDFADKMCADKRTPIRELEDQIAEFHYRRPVVIIDFAVFNPPFHEKLQFFKGILCIRPFWRDGKKAPPLPVQEPRQYYSHHY